MDDLLKTLETAAASAETTDAAMAEVEARYARAKELYAAARGSTPAEAVKTLLKRFAPWTAALGGAGGLGAVVAQPGFVDNLMMFVRGLF